MVKAAAIAIIILLFGAVWGIFINFEKQYEEPTPVPNNYQEIPLLSDVRLSFLKKNNKPTLIHFFNPNCSYSIFNLEDFKFLSRKYESTINFVVAIHLKEAETYDLNTIKSDFGNTVQIINDSSKEIAEKVGVYATPQAVIINENSQIYYRGNYNKARFCTSKPTNFVELSLMAVLNKQDLPIFDEKATIPYGCVLPANNI